MRNKRLSKKLRRICLNLINGLSKLNTAGLSAATGVNLGLYHHDLRAKFLGCGHRFIHSGNAALAVRHVNTVGFQHLLALILMDVHKYASQ